MTNLKENFIFFWLYTQYIIIQHSNTTEIYNVENEKCTVMLYSRESSPKFS